MASLVERIDLLELDLRRVQRELQVLRREARAATTETPEPAAAPAPAPVPRPVVPARPPAQEGPTRPQPSVDLGARLARLDLLGARGLAIAGGAVTALGITLLFVLATERGWIGPVERVGAGALVSALVFGAGLVLRRRYGQIAAALAAVGAGIAGGYATLAAATVLYELVPDAAALGIAAAIAGLAVAVSLAWGSQLVAALGLVGAACAPALEALDAGIGAVGVAFGVVVLGATAVVAVRRRWARLLVAVLGVVGAEAAWLAAADAPAGTPATLAVTGALIGVVLVSASAWQVTGNERALSVVAGPMVLAAFGSVLLSGQALFDTAADRAGWLAVGASAFALGWLALRRVQPDFALVLAAGSLGLVAVAVANVVSDDGLTLSWAAESAVLSLLALRFRDARLQLAALGYLALATAHLVTVTEPFGELFAGASVDASTAIPTFAVAAAATTAGLLAPHGYTVTGEVGMLAFLGSVRAALLAGRARVVETLVAGASTLGVVAFGILAVSLDVPGGHLALGAVAALVALAGTVVAPRRRARGLAVASLAGSFLVVAEATAYDFAELPDHWGAPSLLVAAAGLLAAGVLVRVGWETPARLGLASGAAATVAFVASFAALDALVPDLPATAARVWATFGTSAIAVAYLVPAAWALRRPRLRNLATTLWALGLVALLAAELVAADDPQVFAVAVAVTVAVAAFAGRRVGEPRLSIAAAVLVVLDGVGVLAWLTPPWHLLSPSEAPASGVGALVAVAAATAVVALTAPGRDRWILGVSAGLLLYAVSLVVLELVIRLSGASLETDFERGHTVVSAVWGVTGLTVLVVGLFRRSAALRYAGLALFGVTLAKIFLFDLAELSSLARAASFVAVGALLLAGGALVQRLGEREPDILER
ncbi:MAG TPA: DUF2339 domain-containing protein [Gaiella sp.]|nr:DUF2339 domain-containing protein [Gaiella sp.]